MRWVMENGMVLVGAAIFVGLITTSACTQTKVTSDKAPTVQEPALSEAQLAVGENGAETRVDIYNDPGGCQYLVFGMGSRGQTAVVRQRPNTNGMCYTSQK